MGEFAHLLSKNRFIYIVSFIDANRNIADTFKFTDTSVVYENDYLKLTIPAGWKATEAPQTNYQGNCGSGKTDCTIVPTLVPNPGAVNITKGNYILYINTQAGHASGVEGGRFSEIAYGAPSVTATLKDISSGVTCGIVD